MDVLFLTFFRFLINVYHFWEELVQPLEFEIQMIVLDKLDEDGMPITENVTTNEEEFEIVRDGNSFLNLNVSLVPNIVF